MTTQSSQRTGQALAITAFSIWGVVALYWEQVRSVPAVEMLAHRAVWASLLLVTYMSVRGRLRDVVVLLKQPTLLPGLALSAAFIASNWLVFIYAAQQHEYLQASFGYFFNPVLNIALGVVIFGEHLRRVQWWSLAIVLVGVAIRASDLEDFPWIALALALSFSMYAVTRKKLGVDALAGNTVEALLMLPFALGLMAYLQTQGSLTFVEAEPTLKAWIVFAGPVSVVPLLCFAGAATRIPLRVIGQWHYLSPSLQFVLAVWVFNNHASPAAVLAFGVVWFGLALLIGDAFLAGRKAQRAAAATISALPK